MRPILAGLLIAGLSTSSLATTVGDVATLAGERDNFLEGVGIVVGLDGTGDSAGAVAQALSSYLLLRDIAIDPADVAARRSHLGARRVVRRARHQRDFGVDRLGRWQRCG